MARVVDSVLKIHDLKRRVELRLAQKAIYDGCVASAQDAVLELGGGWVKVRPAYRVAGDIDA